MRRATCATAFTMPPASGPAASRERRETSTRSSPRSACATRSSSAWRRRSYEGTFTNSGRFAAPRGRRSPRWRAPTSIPLVSRSKIFESPPSTSSRAEYAAAMGKPPARAATERADAGAPHAAAPERKSSITRTAPLGPSSAAAAAPRAPWAVPAAAPTGESVAQAAAAVAYNWCGWPTRSRTAGIFASSPTARWHRRIRSSRSSASSTRTISRRSRSSPRGRSRGRWRYRAIAIAAPGSRRRPPGASTIATSASACSST